MANALQYETSPYLLQHANNPVNWVPWHEKFLRQAEVEDKLVLVSIGYSACHWCHVMEHEVFEDRACAELMNRHFINIKVDREERPDIDHVYMNALQLMTGRGGWPLNCIILPDGRPVYGGTYFPKEKWKQTLETLVDIWTNDRAKMYEYAEQLSAAMQKGEPAAQNTGTQNGSTHELLENMVNKWKNGFDEDFGGPRKAPKFPLPNNYRFLLRHALDTGDKTVREHTLFTLKMMAYGGIYDQIGGGFSRYSVDAYWKVPHFEKMLYDNAQLISLYAEGFAAFKEPMFEETVHEIIRFCEREMKGSEGGWISALDADSEGVEGKFYVWKFNELQELLGEDFEMVREYYNVNAEGFWEDGNYILMRQTDDDTFVRTFQLDASEWKIQKERIKQTLLQARSKRIRPGADDKILLSWNALMISGLCHAYRYTRKCAYLELAENTWQFLETRMKKEGRWMRSYKNGEAKIPAFLEDFAFLSEAALNLAEVSFKLSYADKAGELLDETLSRFYEPQKNLFRFRASDQPQLAAETYETQDNVMPASNSQMALNLFRAGRLLNRPEWENMAVSMAEQIKPEMGSYGPGYSNWAMLLQLQDKLNETVFVGKNATLEAARALSELQPYSFIAASDEPAEHPLFQNRYVEGKLLKYICIDRACGLPEEIKA